MKIPQKITPCPIIDSNIELRFESTMPIEAKEATFGIIFSKFKLKYPGIEKLPILQLPEAIRGSDPNFKYKPYYKLSNDHFVLQIGPNVVSLGSVVKNNNYIGWKTFSKEIKEFLGCLDDLKLIKKIERLGIRYINYFKEDVFDNIALKFTLDNAPFKSENIMIGVVIIKNGFTNRIQIANQATITSQNTLLSGSIFDIDTHIEEPNDNYNDLLKLIENGHQTEKEIFFDFLDKNFLKSLNPEY